ncbi:MAG: hypothetical protein B1H05_00925 [Candidatus Cloacimonas sp. 4484_140]|nr:MAG: hypothetical protein B1H05_00925 [Candidatus Cloacimonas sp. 4484_140]
MDEKIIKEYLPLVKSIASKYSNSSVPFEDLVQEGTIGLWKAWQRYDESRGAKFSTYASYWIKKRILDAISKDRKNSLNAIHYDEEITNAAGSRQEEVVPEDKVRLPENFPEKEKNILTMLYGRDGQGSYDLAEIGEKMGLPRERVRQLKEKGLRRLRKIGIIIKE